MAKKVSVKGVARQARAAEKKFLQAHPKPKPEGFTQDSFQNFALNLGVGTDNALSSSTYGFNPITRVRTELEWIHRGTWIGGMAVDIPAEDMTREGIDIQSTLEPDDNEALEELADNCDIWSKFCEGIQWGRLYGGCIIVPLIDGQDPSTPLNIDRVGKDQFLGLMVLDRWCLEPSLEDLVATPGPFLGLPKFYFVTSDAPAYRGQRIHYTRAWRFTGIKLPYWQRVMENLWGISVIERLYDRMIAFDSATTGAAQLVYKSYLRTLKMPKLREAVASGGEILKGVVNAVNFMRLYQSQEGISLIDGQDEMVEGGATSFSGINEALLQFAQQLSGAMQVPLVRLLGQSPAGLNSTGESDLRTYYDGIRKRQRAELKRPVHTTYLLMGKSLGIDLSGGFNFNFRSLWLMSEEERADISKTQTESILGAYNDAVYDRATALRNLRDSARTVGVHTNITDEMIEEAEKDPPMPQPGDPPMPEPGQTEVPGGEAAAGIVRPKGATSDSAMPEPGKMRLKDFQGLPVTIETAQGEWRRGGKGAQAWQVVMPVDYGFIEGTWSAEGIREQMDCFVGPIADAPRVWVIDQKNPRTGLFDEHKCMLGFGSEADAVDTYVRAYHDSDRRRIGGVTGMTFDDFKTWLRNGDLARPVGKLMAMP